MTCETIRLPDGGTAIVCSRGRRRPRCSTPGCNQYADLECDAPVARKQRRDPREGDARLSKKTSKILYVWSYVDGVVTVSLAPPGVPGSQTWQTSKESWLERTSATCNRKICRACAVKVGDLDYCGPHGRAALKNEKSKG